MHLFIWNCNKDRTHTVRGVYYAIYFTVRHIVFMHIALYNINACTNNIGCCIVLKLLCERLVGLWRVFRTQWFICSFIFTRFKNHTSCFEIVGMSVEEHTHFLSLLNYAICMMYSFIPVWYNDYLCLFLQDRMFTVPQWEIDLIERVRF